MKKMEKIDELEEFKEKMQKEDSDKLKLTSNCLHILISWATILGTELKTKYFCIPECKQTNKTNYDEFDTKMIDNGCIRLQHTDYCSIFLSKINYLEHYFWI